MALTLVSFQSLAGGDTVEVNPSEIAISSLSIVPPKALPTGVAAGTHIAMQNGGTVSVRGTLADTINTLAAGSTTSGPPMQRTLSSFDPGAAVPHRWNVAFAAAQAACAVTPFALAIDGDFTFDQRITFVTRMVLLGNPVTSFMRWSVSGNAGMLLSVTVSERSYFSGLNIIGPAPFAGQADIGLLVNASRCAGDTLLFRNWGGIALSCEGDVGFATNSNNGTWTNVTAELCGNATAHQTGKNAGFYMDGGDSNNNVFVACRAFDCRRGFYDSSFLGNAFTGCAVEGCNDRFTKNPGDPTTGYGFITDDPNAHSTLNGCYVELDSESDVNDPAIWIGGIVVNRGNARQFDSGGVSPDFTASHQYIDPNDPSTKPNRATGMTIGGRTAGVAAQLFVNNPETGIPPVQPTNIVWGVLAAVSTWWRLNFAGLDDSDILRWKGKQLWFPNGFMRGYPTGATSGMREELATSIGAATTTDGGPWSVGDRVTIKTPAAGQPSMYRCVAVGPGPTFTPTWSIETTLAP